jgi:glycosyltransferase involved in cell wall biosynthesis
MRIAFDHQIFFWQSYGGISRYITKLANSLLGMEQQVGVFAPLHRNNYLSELPKRVVNGRHINSYPPKSKMLFFQYNQLRSRFQIAKWQPDLVHETYYSKTSSSSNSYPTVITVHDMIHELFPEEFSRYDNTADIKRIAISRSDHIICVSENTKLDLMRLYGTSSNKLSVVHLGFDKFAIQDVSKDTVLSQKPFLLYVGARGGYKNFTGFLKAVATSRQLLSDFDIIAFGGAKFSAAELDLICSLGFSENQVRHKSGDDSLLGHFYNTAKALIYPSLYEGFGIPPLEAMAHHCPVISSCTSSMPEIIGKAGEYFDPANIDDMQHVIESVVYSDSRIECLRKLGKELLSSYSWDKCAHKTLGIYRSLK